MGAAYASQSNRSSPGATVLLVPLAVAILVAAMLSALGSASALAAQLPAGSPAASHRGNSAGPVLLVSHRARPRGVGRKRFVRVLRQAARYWGVRVPRGTARVAGRRDGVNVIGFSRRVGRRGPGKTTQFIRSVNGQVVHREIDVSLNAATPWQDGPALPSASQWDLETVVLHELGHVVGARHTRRCRNSPMYHALGNGEWWRGRYNWYRRGCRNAAW